MSEDLNTAWKMGISVAVMAFILSMGLTLMLIGRHAWNTVADQITTPVLSMQDNDAFYLASYDKPVPVADIRKVVSNINYGAPASSINGNFSSFQIKEQSDVNPNEWYLVSTSIADLDNYLARKAYMSWEFDEISNLYEMVVYLVA